MPSRPASCILVGRLEHEGKRLLHVALEGLEEPSGNGPVDSPVVGGHGDVHDLGGLEPSARGGRRDGDDLGEGSSDGEDAGLRRVDDGGEVGDAEHAEVGDGEGSSLHSDTTHRKENYQLSKVSVNARGRSLTRI
jgi:hypothetical protein